MPHQQPPGYDNVCEMNLRPHTTEEPSKARSESFDWHFVSGKKMGHKLLNHRKGIVYLQGQTIFLDQTLNI